MIKRLLTDRFVAWRYLRAGAILGEMASYFFVGKSVGYDRAHSSFVRWETEYTRRGYRPISMDDFIGAGGYGVNIEHLLLVRNSGQKDPA